MLDYSDYEYVGRGKFHFSYKSPECLKERGDLHIPHAQIQKWIEYRNLPAPRYEDLPLGESIKADVRMMANNYEKEISLLKLTLEVVQRYHRGDDPYDYSKMADVGQQMGEDWEFVDELITKALE